ncbi:major facilitator superfamily transporter [Thozetella sp. PMI_491]|nr:major facilitator superfamily transporter [Thozetella sp. PMI_491]
MSATKAFAIWCAIALSAFGIFLDEGIISTAIPQITDDFQSLADVGWYGSAYNLTLCAMQLLFGRMFTTFHVKSVYLASVLLFEVGSLICALSHNSVTFIVGRAVAGFGASGVSSGACVIIGAALPAEKLPFYMGALGMVYGIGAVIGPVVGGVITNSYLTWRWCFWINLPLAVPTVAAVFFMIKIPPKPLGEKMTLWDKLKALDPLGTVLLLPSIISFILALQYGGTLATWGDGRTIACFVVSGVLIIAFAIEQAYMGDKGLVPPRLVKDRMIVFSGLYAFCLDSAYYILSYYLPIWFQAIENTSAGESGLRFLALIIALVVSIFVAGWVVTKFGYCQPFMLLGGILAAVGAGLLSTLTTISGSNLWIPFQVIAGLGIGFGTQQPAVLVQSLLEDDDGTLAVAIVVFGQCFGPTVSITVAQAVFSSVLISGITSQIPGLDPEAVRNAGATDLRKLVAPSQLDALLGIYNRALTRTFITAAVLAAIATFLVAGIPLRKLKGEEGQSDKEELAEKPLESSEKSKPAEGLLRSDTGA